MPENEFLTRSGASPEDLIVVSGRLGNAALGLAQLRNEINLPEGLREICVDAILRPQPRLELVAFLRQYATAAIDISDGLVADLGHLLGASGCGAVIDRSRLPVDDWIREHDAFHYAIAAGDDYEICFCVSPDNRDAIETWNRQSTECPLTLIGEISETGFSVTQDGEPVDYDQNNGFRHFG